MNIDRYSQAMLAIVSHSEASSLQKHLFIELLMMVKHSGLSRLFNGFKTQAVAAKKTENNKPVQLHIDLVKFSHNIWTTLPHLVANLFPECFFFQIVIQLKVVIEVNHYKIPESVYEEVRDLNTYVKLVENASLVSMTTKLRKNVNQPPDDFRGLSIYTITI